jgi:hypothetical protein
VQKQPIMIVMELVPGVWYWSDIILLCYSLKWHLVYDS